MLQFYLSMWKMVRNTAFTVAALGLTSLGLAWNKDIAANLQPVPSEQAVLAAQTVTNNTKQAFPLTVAFANPSVRLGQYQELRITTVPDASLEIVTAYPDGNTNNPQTLLAKADQRGIYRLRFKLGDWRNLGLFKATVTAKTGNSTARASSNFVLQTWSDGTNGSLDYVYPLVP